MYTSLHSENNIIAKRKEQETEEGKAREIEHTNVFRFKAGTLSVGLLQLPCALGPPPPSAPAAAGTFLGKIKQAHESVTLYKFIQKGHLKLNR